MNSTAYMCSGHSHGFVQDEGLALSSVSGVKGKALNLEEVGKWFFTEVSGNGFSSALCISPSRHWMSNQKEDCGKYCETELYPV